MSRFAMILSLMLGCLAWPPGVAAADEAAARTVLITGANRGIGLELARQFGEAGYRVIGTARQPDKADALQETGARVLQLDVTDPASVASLAEQLDGGPIDLLVNNAGIGGQEPAPLANTDVDRIARTFDVNSLGPLRVTQALLPNLLAGRDARVVQLSSIMGSIELNRGGYYGYRASKAALNMLNASLAAELGPQGVICTVLHPGWVKTRMGGDEAPVEVADSAAGLIRVIEQLSAEDNGRFYDYQGKTIPW